MLGMKTITRITLSCAILALMAIQAKPQGTLLTEEVEVCGLKNISLKKIKQTIRTQPGKPFSAEQANQDFERLMGMKAFDSERSKIIFVDGERGGKIVRFELTEIPKNK
jgi:outer membrane protein assembly factor BamA